MTRLDSFRSLFAVVVCAGWMSFTGIAVGQEVSGAAGVRQQLDNLQRMKQESDKELTLQQGAASVAAQRVEELKQQLAEAEGKAAAATAQAVAWQQKSAALGQQVEALAAALPQHEAADALVEVAARATARLETMQQARQKLQTDLAAVRKSSVEWRSRGTDADQQIAALVAARPELEKKVAETRPPADAADATVVAAQTSLTAAQTLVDTTTAMLAAEETQLASAMSSMEKLTTSLKSLQDSLSALKEASRLTGVDSSTALAGLEKTITDLMPLKANADAVLTVITGRRDAQSAALTVAKTDLEQKTAAVQAAVAAAEPLKTAATMAADALAASVQQEAGLKETRATSELWQRTLNSRLVALEPSLQKLNAELQIVNAETLVVRRQAESALEPLGRFVSFSRHVAPILADRCVACHNTRSPGGRLNLDSFAALMKGGESGPAVSAHHSGESALLTLIQDGSMPKDADPLSAEDVATLKHWIDVGAPLDAGLIATADLFDVIPERSQPMPPGEYRVAIPVTAVVFSPDGSQLASSGYHEVLVWNAADGALIRRIANVAERVYDLEYSADGSLLAVAAGTPGQLGELKLFSATDGTLLRTLVRSRDAVFAVSFSPDGQQLACAGADRSISVVQVATGEEVTRIEDHADWVMDINWSPNGQRLVSSSRDKTCKVFDAATGNPVITFPGHGEPVYTAAFLADGTTVVSGGGDKRLRVWNSADAKEIRGIGGFSGDVFRLQVLAQDQVLSASGDRMIHLHNAADGAEVRKLTGHNDWVYTLSANPGRKLFASGSYDGEIRLWNSEDGSMLTSFVAVPKGQQAVAVTAP